MQSGSFLGAIADAL